MSSWMCILYSASWQIQGTADPTVKRYVACYAIYACPSEFAFGIGVYLWGSRHAPITLCQQDAMCLRYYFKIIPRRMIPVSTFPIERGRTQQNVFGIWLAELMFSCCLESYCRSRSSTIQPEHDWKTQYWLKFLSADPSERWLVLCSEISGPI